MIAIADPSPMMRGWLQMGVAPLGGTILQAGDGVELLDLVADYDFFDVVIANSSLPVIGGEQVLAMMRTAGDRTPFILIAPFCRESVRALIARLGRAVLVEDPLDGAALLHVVKALVHDCRDLTEVLSEPPFPVRGAKPAAQIPRLPSSERSERRVLLQCPQPTAQSKFLTATKVSSRSASPVRHATTARLAKTWPK